MVSAALGFLVLTHQGTTPVPTSSTPTSRSLPIFSFPFVGRITASSDQAVRFPAEGSSELGLGVRETSWVRLSAATVGHFPRSRNSSHVQGPPYSTGGIWDLSTAVRAQRPTAFITAVRRASPLGDALHVNWEANVLTALVLAQDAEPSLLSDPRTPSAPPRR